MKVDQILRAKGVEVFSVQTTDSIDKAISVLSDKNIGVVIVKDSSGKISGILSERDIVRHLGVRGAAALTMNVSECMTPDPITCGLETTVDELMGLMTAKRIRHLPVVTDDTVVGVISIGDVVKRKIGEAEQEAEALKEYIAS
ncbi:MAG: CBS domain-containing protein [Alphaproteobacteria bacterium]|nr:CBS domain-containing protein [Marinicaulis sp.]NOX95694.1 CBS domain-containing protein [Alphaproteobacteria bacterium]